MPSQHRRAVAGRAHPPAHLQAVEPRHQHVEHDRVERVERQRANRLASVGCHLDLEAVEVEHERERLSNGGVVVDHQQTHGAILAGETERNLNGRALARRWRPRR
jgi:hypothetical protein